VPRTPVLPAHLAALLAAGTVIPAHPLALDANRHLDERRQRALTRYYHAAGAGGVAVAVHTTQFEIRDDRYGLFEPVLALAADVLDKEATHPMIRIAGAVGPTSQAMCEAATAAQLGYHAVLLSPLVVGASEEQLLDRARAVGDVLPIVGFYLQAAIGGPVLSREFWRAFADIPAVVAIKAAPFNRYRTLDVVLGLADSARADEVSLYTGNDDSIISDLLAVYHLVRSGRPVERRIVGGLLGQWAVGTQAAVKVLGLSKRAHSGDADARAALISMATDLTDFNAAVFDPAHDFAGVIAGVHEVLRQQGLLEGTWCLDPKGALSPGQAEEIRRARRMYPCLTDDDFVAEHRDEWLR